MFHIIICSFSWAQDEIREEINSPLKFESDIDKSSSQFPSVNMSFSDKVDEKMKFVYFGAEVGKAPSGATATKFYQYRSIKGSFQLNGFIIAQDIVDQVRLNEDKPWQKLSLENLKKGLNSDDSKEVLKTLKTLAEYHREIENVDEHFAWVEKGFVLDTDAKVIPSGFVEVSGDGIDLPKDVAKDQIRLFIPIEALNDENISFDKNQGKINVLKSVTIMVAKTLDSFNYGNSTEEEEAVKIELDQMLSCWDCPLKKNLKHVGDFTLEILKALTWEIDLTADDANSQALNQLMCLMEISAKQCENQKITLKLNEMRQKSNLIKKCPQ